MGNMAFFSSILITAAISFYYSRSFNRYAAILLVSILALDTLIIGNYFGIERLGERLREVGSDSSSQGRIELQEYNLTILSDHLWLGAGAGTYETVFTPYRDAPVSHRADHTEMDYMEFLIELGVIGALPLLGILFTGLHAQVRMLGSMSPTFDRGIAFGCLAGTVSLLIHGIGDVNLQIPANALLFVLLLALPIAMMESRQSSHLTGS
jgi:O-antigen ligase